MKSASGLRRIMPSFTIMLGIAVISLLSGCGIKGPLYLPGTKMPSGQSRNAIPTLPPATTSTNTTNSSTNTSNTTTTPATTPSSTDVDAR
ncbi:lipoprotein [uncultured Oxalicibacterium sp.]|uniref:LPS translocon maturation chaperone LptM n=1 Tax=uncultured Oxalicibacterium sp. TaxID=1168540 RepID=UPI0025F1F779|nr:lipoprotein [uncultured Oxalicibacterium sp.]